jgi:hypothetical protein
MILKLIQNYVKSKETDLNDYLDTEIHLKQIQTELDIELIGASESYIHYQLYVSSIDKGNAESQRLVGVKVRLQFIFLVANKDYTVYSKILDRYIYGLFRVLRSKQNVSYKDEDISSSIKINNLTDIQVTNADTFEEDYYKPSIEFTLQVIDKSEIISSQIIDSDAVSV